MPLTEAREVVETTALARSFRWERTRRSLQRRNLGTPKPTSHSRRLEALGQVSFDVSEAEL